MKNIKTALFYLLCLLVISCASKKTSVEKEKKVNSDSTNTTLTLSTKNIFKIETICDTVTGRAKDFINITDNGLVKTTTEIKNNIFTSTTETDSTEQKVRIVKEYVTVYKEKEIEKYKVPFWHWVAHVLSVVLILILLYFLFRKKLRLPF